MYCYSAASSQNSISRVSSELSPNKFHPFCSVIGTGTVFYLYMCVYMRASLVTAPDKQYKRITNRTNHITDELFYLKQLKAPPLPHNYYDSTVI